LGFELTSDIHLTRRAIHKGANSKVIFVAGFKYIDKTQNAQTGCTLNSGRKTNAKYLYVIIYSIYNKF